MLLKQKSKICQIQENVPSIKINILEHFQLWEITCLVAKMQINIKIWI
jgi:hypothetical protein